MKKNILAVSAIALAGILAIAPVYANEGHGHDDDHGSEKNHHDSKMAGDDHHGDKKDGMVAMKKEVDGYTVNFHIMRAKPGKEMGGSHDVMVKIEKDGKIVNNVVMKTKVVHPNGKSESKKAMRMGNSLMAGYNLGHEGKHKFMTFFKTSDGEKHKAGIAFSM